MSTTCRSTMSRTPPSVVRGTPDWVASTVTGPSRNSPLITGSRFSTHRVRTRSEQHPGEPCNCRGSSFHTKEQNMKSPSRMRPGRARLGAAVVLPLALMFGAGAQAAQWENGQELYDNLCGKCHKPEVGVGVPIQGRGLPFEYVKAIVRNGFRAMPAFPEAYIDDESLAQVTEYIASLPAHQPKQK